MQSRNVQNGHNLSNLIQKCPKTMEITKKNPSPAKKVKGTLSTSYCGCLFLLDTSCPGASTISCSVKDFVGGVVYKTKNPVNFIEVNLKDVLRFR